MSFALKENRKKGDLTVKGYETSHPLNMVEYKYMGLHANRLAQIVVGMCCGCFLTASICPNKNGAMSLVESKK